MPIEKRTIGLIPVGEAPVFAAKVIAGHVAGYLNLGAEILAPIENPFHAFDAKRCQYNAGIILKSLEDLDAGPFEKVIAVMDVDLFVPIFTHVFGEARQGGRFAVVSLFRLKKEVDGFRPPFTLVCERAAKTAIHELGHLFDLSHCDDEHCLMHFSGDLRQLDRISFRFCRYCTAFLMDALG
jgi:archaemetzincin